MDHLNTSNPSLENILIPYSEFERLKNIETEYIRIQESQQKNFDLKTDQPSTSRNFQTGKGSEYKMKKRKITDDYDLSDTDSDSIAPIVNHITKMVVKKIAAQKPQVFTSLFQAQDSLPLEVEVANEDTTPPLPYSQKISKGDENDSYGTLVFHRVLSTSPLYLKHNMFFILFQMRSSSYF